MPPMPPLPSKRDGVALVVSIVSGDHATYKHARRPCQRLNHACVCARVCSLLLLPVAMAALVPSGGYISQAPYPGILVAAAPRRLLGSYGPPTLPPIRLPRGAGATTHGVPALPYYRRVSTRNDTANTSNPRVTPNYTVTLSPDGGGTNMGDLTFLYAPRGTSVWAAPRAYNLSSILASRDLQRVATSDEFLRLFAPTETGPPRITMLGCTITTPRDIGMGRDQHMVLTAVVQGHTTMRDYWRFNAPARTRMWCAFRFRPDEAEGGTVTSLGFRAPTRSHAVDVLREYRRGEAATYFAYEVGLMSNDSDSYLDRRLVEHTAGVDRVTTRGFHALRGIHLPPRRIEFALVVQPEGGDGDGIGIGGELEGEGEGEWAPVAHMGGAMAV